MSVAHRPFLNFQSAHGTLAPECDIEETETKYLMTFDLPGVARDAIKIDAQACQVRVTGVKKFNRDEKEGTKHIIERFEGRFERFFTLPTEIDINKVEAQYEDGVLKPQGGRAERPGLSFFTVDSN